MLYNTSGISISRQLKFGALELQKQIGKIAIGQRVTRAGEGPAELSISETLRAQISGLGVRIRNVQDIISKNHVAEGAYGEINKLAQRMRELSAQAATGTLTTQNREVIQEEIGQIREEINRITRDTLFNRQPAIGDLSPSQLERVNVTTQAGAQNAVESLEEFIETVSSRRGEIGAQTRTLEARVKSLSTQQLNLTAFESRIRDVGIGQAISELKTSQIRGQIGVTVLGKILKAGTQIDLVV